ncbi:putative TRAP transporter [Dinoroseobacter shibae DFL 12 = DSM 16493]|jgi:TRAP transporter 4TM/12TM fusion protein|uniref:Putative TRAP transporter n=1 Tax=Dinoroseobacter shibae (strain DSM 16493 / NCIMB 14021 / DFL 12) TaxID=398580 RepID=A8LRA0_DINSH|nr:TRAP transporter fused permease subunit [Dinoroseobacter shibae]ABV94023.1 putative TRAP transporter [Dinoroseobacter shibae DFL 12 = DSM 16493]
MNQPATIPVANPAPAGGLGAPLGGLFALLVICVIAFATLDEATARFGAIALSVAIVGLAHPARRGRPSGRAVDAALLAGFGCAGWWFHAVKAELWTGFFVATPLSVLAGLAGVFTVIVLAARVWGRSLAILAGALILYAFGGPYLPNAVAHFGVGLGDFVQITWYSFDGVFGRMTGLVASNLLIFLILGAVLQQTGAGESLIRLSTALLGRVRGGGAHAAIAASAVFGMMNGSVAANIAGTGVFTIPMIKRQGFSSRFAGAVEAAASSGGQLTPPIMAATVFVMADLVGLPLLMVIAAAALPALFKYLGLFAQVYVEALRLDIRPLAAEDIPKLTRQDWLQSALVLVPLAVLMIAFLSGSSPAMAGLAGTIAALVTGLVLTPQLRQQPIRIWWALCAGGLASARILLSVAVIGIVLAVVNETGIAIRFAVALSEVGDAYLPLALLMAMLGALVLGMGLPTLPAYLIVAIMIVPTLIEAGVLPLAAHMFVLYFAVFSSIMPPIAYGCFVAAPIAGADALRISFTALRISIVGLIVPFAFVYAPSLLLVAGSFSWAELLTTALRLSLASWLLATALGGADPVLGRLPRHNRMLRGGAACAVMVPTVALWGPGLALGIAMGVLHPLHRAGWIKRVSLRAHGT